MKTRWAAGLVLMAIASLSNADLIANFDGFVEGQWFDTLSTGGIRFHNVSTHGGGYTNFTIENATSGFLGPGLRLPNVLGFGRMSQPRDGVSARRRKSRPS